MKQQSENLTKFYQAYAKWVEAGSPELNPFSRNNGLCANILHFTKAIIKPVAVDGESNLGEVINIAVDLEMEMKQQFTEAGLDRRFPFNDGCWQDYAHESDYGYRWRNTHRMKWVRDHAQ